MLLDATITFLNFGLAKAVVFQRGFQRKEQCFTPITMQTLGHRIARSFNPCVGQSGKLHWISLSGDNRLDDAQPSFAENVTDDMLNCTFMSSFRASRSWHRKVAESPEAILVITS